MRVETKDGGDGVRCWNVAAIRSYADQINQKEARLSGANPDLLVMPGLLKCYGCEVMEYDYGIKCTATLTRTSRPEARIPLARREAKECLAEDMRRLDADEIYHEALQGLDKVQYV